MHLLRSRAPAWTLAGATLVSGLLGAAAVVTTIDHSPAFGSANLADRGWASANPAPPAVEPAAGRPPAARAAGRQAAVPAASGTLIRPPSTRSVTTTPPVVVPPDHLAAAEAAARTACRLELVPDRSPYSDGLGCPSS